MRSFDFAPFYRSTIGFDRLFDMLDQVGGVEGSRPAILPIISSGLPKTLTASRSRSRASPMPIFRSR